MDSVYLISLIVGGFFVLLSIFGGGETEGDFDADADFDAEFDLDADFDGDLDLDGGVDLGGDIGAGVGFVDLLSVRALFLFAAFFGLTGKLLQWTGSSEPSVAIQAVIMGLFAGLGGNYVIKRFAYKDVSSSIGERDYKGRTAKVVLPFDGADRGTVLLDVKGQRLQLPARSLDLEGIEAFSPGEEVVIIRMNGRVAEVVKPN
ncbi:MAG: NfeD family protein [Rhodothermales bacterium]|nr:NfeD family protein [Rhodothermales bacterium]